MSQPFSRLDMYLQWGLDVPAYANTPEENLLVNKFVSLYSMALAAKNANPLSNTENIAKWRKAYYGTLNALKADGTESKRKSKQLRKTIYEFVESKIDNSIPKPKMVPKYKRDTILVQSTEDYLKYNIDNIFTKYLNDKSERSTYVDGTSWYKVWWDSLSNSHNNSGEVKIDICLADQIVPQPGVVDWRKLEYIFELQQMSLTTIYDLFGRIITPVASNQSQMANLNEQADLSTITVITCYYLNENRIVGRFMWAKNSNQVICNDHEWQIRKIRKCTKCGTISPQATTCPVCGSKSFKYETVDKEVLDEDLYDVVNPYEAGETEDKSRDRLEKRIFLTKGTEIPFYKVRQLPFIPRPSVSSIESLYGVSESFMLLDMQDSVNKMLTKMEEKTLKAGAVVTKFKKNKLKDTDESFKIISVKTAEEAAMFQVKQVQADTQQDMVSANLLYESAKAASGVTNSFQGKEDPTATSGKAKQIAAEQSAGRIESLRVMKAAAFAGVYELVLKYLLAFSDEPRQFVKVLPNGQTEEEEWNKYMFLDKDKYGQIYYRDDFSFSTDAASTLSTNRVAMWQETQDKFINGALGNPAEMRTLELYWNMLDQQQYPLANIALAGIKDNSQHLPEELEQLLVNNPQLLQAVIVMAQEQGLVDGGSGQGGARAGAGRPGNGATHAANVERTNERNRADNRQVVDAAQGSATGGSIK